MLQDPIIGGSLLLTYTTGYVAPLLIAASFAGALQVRRSLLATVIDLSCNILVTEVQSSDHSFYSRAEPSFISKILCVDQPSEVVLLSFVS